MKLMPECDYIDFTRYAFISNKKHGSYAYIQWSFDSEEEHIMFHCEHCNKHYESKELKIKNQAVHCKCGAIVKIADFRPYTHSKDYHFNKIIDILNHNLNNGTLNKLNVPTIIDNKEFYCPHCHEKKELSSYKKENDMLICDCGQSYIFEECKIQESVMTWNIVAGNYYIDNNKISISLVQQHIDENKFGKLYWETGTTRATINLETGYSFISNTGCCYTDFNKIWKRYHDKNSNAPKLFNATYNNYGWEHLNNLVALKTQQLQIKYNNYPNLVKLISKNRYNRLATLLKHSIASKMDKHMTKYYNEKYSYKIKSYEELVNEYLKKQSCQRKDSMYMYDILRSLVIRNRFVNANYMNITRNLPIMFDTLKQSDIKNKYAKLNRETNEPIYDLCNAFIPMSKSLRKRITKDYIGKELQWDDTLFQFLYMAKCFTKKENINKLYNMITIKIYATYPTTKEGMKFWLKFRSEEYISNIKDAKTFIKKYNSMKDSHYLLKKVKEVYGDDWNENSIVFHNEKQYHDALVEITSSQAYQDLVDKQRREKLSIPFEMEDKIFELENKDITIALNEYELGVIGNNMHICVGGYGNEVRNYGCRIAYIKHDNEYVACLELRTKQTKKNSKITYELHQAKLKYNAYVGTNEKYYNIVYDWCQANNIEIKTNDMDVNFKDTNKVVEEYLF